MNKEIMVRERNSVKHGVTYEYRFEIASVDGKRKWASKGGFLDFKSAYAAGLEAQKQYLCCGQIAKTPDMSYSDFLDIWFENECKAVLKDTTQYNYQKRIKNHIKPAIGKYQLKSIDKSLLQKLLNSLHNDGYSKNSIITVKSIITKSFVYAVDNKYLTNSPATGLKLPRFENTAVPTRSAPHSYISSNEISCIFNYFTCGTSAYIPLLLGYRCGLRLGETFALTWDDIDFANKTLSVNKQIQWKRLDRTKEEKLATNGKSVKDSGYWYFSEPKYKSYRVIDIDEDLLSILLDEKEKQAAARSYFKDRYSNNYVDKHRHLTSDPNSSPVSLICVREDGSYINPRTMQYTSRVIKNNLGIKDFDYHSLRHTHATMLMENAAPLKYIQHRLGHKSIDVTINVYQHLTDTLSEKGQVVISAMFK